MSHNYLKLQNQGSIYQNLMLLNEMNESNGYSDINGYFSKKDVAEIAINSNIITSEGKSGEDILSFISDDGEDESRNSVLQNAKARMQLLRVLGLISSDYSAEQYAITDLGEKVLNQVFPSEAGHLPDYRLLKESFMRISTTSEVYNFNCDYSFNCYIGYEICYAFSKLNYRISVQEMPCITTYDISDIGEFIKDVKSYRKKKKPFPETHEHFPKTQKGTPLTNASNITRTINQILRICGIIERKNVCIDGVNYYICTEDGKKYVDDIKENFKNLKFWTTNSFRRENLLSQQTICSCGYFNMLQMGGYDVQGNMSDLKTVFSPYQLIPETNANWLLCNNIRKPPVSKETQVQVINSQISPKFLRLKPSYRTQEEYDNFIRLFSTKSTIISEILNAKESGMEKDEIIKELFERHKNSDKELFYPFVHSLLSALGLECKGEIARYDEYIVYNGKIIPAEIKSFTESPTYNMKGIRQALENKICTYKSIDDLEYATLLIGYSHPCNTAEIQLFIDAAYDEWKIKILSIDLLTLIKMCVRTIWDKQSIDFESLFKGHGIVEA